MLSLYVRLTCQPIRVLLILFGCSQERIWMSNFVKICISQVTWSIQLTFFFSVFMGFRLFWLLPLLILHLREVTVIAKPAAVNCRLGELPGCPVLFRGHSVLPSIVFHMWKVWYRSSLGILALCWPLLSTIMNWASRFSIPTTLLCQDWIWVLEDSDLL